MDSIRDARAETIANTATTPGIRISDTALCPTSKRILTQELRKVAANDHCHYAQYDGYFDAWTLHRVTTTSTFKGGSTIPEGRIVLASPTVDVHDEFTIRRAYDPSTGHVVAFPTQNIRSL